MMCSSFARFRTENPVVCRFDCLSALMFCSFFTLMPLSAAESRMQKTTHVYKTAGDIRIALDAYRPGDDTVRPVVVWIHGGALIVGSREAYPANLLEFCQQEGAAFVSLDYRLAPEVKLPQIAEDLDDAFIWLRGEGAKTLHIDPERMVIAGGSAGGFCTYLAVSRMKQKPRAIVTYWGYGEFDADWTAVKSQDHGDPVPRELAEKHVHQGVITAPTKEQGQNRGMFYRYTRQQGLWAKTVTGFDPVTGQNQIARFAPIQHIGRDFLPPLMLHGTADTDVPYACSVRMAEEFRRQGVKHELVTVEHGGHGLSGVDEATKQQAHDRALAFIRGQWK